MSETRTINKSKKRPTFLVEFWARDNYEEVFKNNKCNDKMYQRMWSGEITHIQKDNCEKFNNLNEMIKFIEENKLKDE